MPEPAAEPRVAWIADPKKFGVKKGYPKADLRERLQKEGGFSFVRVTAEEIRAGALNRATYDVFIVPGGYAPNFAGSLGSEGGRRIRDFVSGGGGFIGICAGAYLGSSWGYNLLPVSILDIEHWDRGKVDDCRLRSTPAGRLVAGATLAEAFTARYNNGPLFDPLDGSVEALLEFESDLRGKSGRYPSLMPGSPAAVAGPCGQGRVVLLSPHLESSPSLGEVLRNFVRWAGAAGTASSSTAAPPPPPPPVRPRTPLRAPSAEAVGGDAAAAAGTTEAQIVAALRLLDSRRDGTVRWEELLDVALDADLDKERLESWRAGPGAGAEGDLVRYEEFAAWLCGTPGVAEPPDGDFTDGEEDAHMDVPSLVRLHSLAQFESIPEGEPSLADGDAGADAPPPPVQTPALCRSCSGVQRAVGEAEVQASVVRIQRAARARPKSSAGGATGAAPAAPARASRTRTSAASAAPAVPPAARARSPAPAAAPGPAAPLLGRGAPEYFCWLGGPILLSAPHSIKIMRGGGDTQEKARAHKRERYTAEGVLTVARELHRAGLPASVLVWNRGAGPGKGRLDPNYLLASQFGASPWHRALHRWALGQEGVPLLHVDLHGKVSEKLHLDLGSAPLEELWPREDMGFVLALKRKLVTLLDQALDECGVSAQRGRPIAVDPNPYLSGLWGQDTVTTISHQSVMLGVPAVQFEMPPKVREALVSDAEFGRRFAAAVMEAYRDVVVPWWAERLTSRTPWPRTRSFDPAWAADVDEVALPGGASGFVPWSERLLAELLHMERSTTEVQI